MGYGKRMKRLIVKFKSSGSNPSYRKHTIKIDVILPEGCWRVMESCWKSVKLVVKRNVCLNWSMSVNLIVNVSMSCCKSTVWFSPSWNFKNWTYRNIVFFLDPSMNPFIGLITAPTAWPANDLSWKIIKRSYLPLIGKKVTYKISWYLRDSYKEVP